MNTLQIQRTERIKKLLGELNGCLKMSVSKAIEIGEQLSAQKNDLNHGEFLPWLESNFEMGHATAYKYMNLHKHQSKILLSGNLQDAYKQIEQIEYQEKRTREIEDQRIVSQRITTGKKPEGWERRHDQLYKARTDQEAFNERLKNQMGENEQRVTPKTSTEDLNQFQDDLKKTIEMNNRVIAEENRKAQARKNLRISSNDETRDQEIWFESFRDYIYSIDNVNRRLEIIQNFLKYLRGLGTECQRDLANNKEAV